MGGLKRGRPPKRWLRGRRPVVFDAFLELVAHRRLAVAPRRAARAGGSRRLFRVVAALAEILRLDVADVQEAVAAHAEIDECRLDARFQVDDHPFVDVADVIVLAGPFNVQLFQNSVLDDRDPAFLRSARR